MPYLLVRHKVTDFAKWKAVFDQHGPARRAAGSRGGHLFRGADDPNEVVVLLEVDSVDKARQFTQAPDLKEVMERAGISGKPDIHFLEEVEKPGA